MTLTKGSLLPWLLTILATGSLASVQALYDRASSSYTTELQKAAVNINEPLVPSTLTLQALSLGNPSVAADLLWLQTIQYFGGGNPYGKYPALGKLLLRVTELDPHFEYPYQFGLIVLPYMDQLDAALQLGEQGAQALPNSALINFYLASDYHLNAHNYQKAAFYYDKASKLPGAPGASQRLAAIALSQVNNSLSDRLAAEAFWQTVADNAQTDEEREQAIQWYKHIDIVYTIEKAAQDYKAATGHFPSTQEELVQKRLLPQVLTSPIHRELKLDPTTGRVDFSKSTE